MMECGNLHISEYIGLVVSLGTLDRSMGSPVAPLEGNLELGLGGPDWRIEVCLKT